MRFITRLSLPRTLAVLLAAACWMQTANAGTKGSMINTFGRGVAVNTVVYNGVTNTAKSTLTSNPSSAVYDFDYGLEGLPDGTVSIGLPDGTPKEIFSRSLGTAPGVWTWDAFVMDGATADNPALTAKLPIIPAGFAKYKVKSTSFVDGPNKIGYLALEGFATKGAGVWLRAIEFKGIGAPRDIEDLETNGTLKGEVTLAGPFFFDPTNCTDIKIPFTFQGDDDKIFFVADGVALSVPFTVSSPDLNGQCGVPVNYPTATVTGGSGTNTVSYSIPSGSVFGYGVTVVTMVVTDTYLGITPTNTVGFRKTNTFKVTVTDTEPPKLTCPEPIVQTTDPGQCLATVNVLPPTATDNCGAAVGGVRSDERPLNAAYLKGVTTITWTATDAAGNSTNCTQTITVIDNENPVISGMPANISLTSSTGNPTTCAQVATWTPPTATDNCGVTSFTSTHGSGASFPVGVTIVTYTAVDAATNTTTASFTVTVTDNTKPVITCPAPIVTSTGTSGCYAMVSVTPATATDNCGSVSVTGVRSDGQLLGAAYPKGVTTITWTATDTAGNTATCTQTVTVNDTVKPIAKAKPATILLDATGNASITAAQINDGSSDNCAIKSITISKGSFNCGNLGANIVTLTVTDTSDNVSTAVTTVTVLDNIAPVPNAFPATVTSDCSAAVSLPLLLATDNCSGVVTGTTPTRLFSIPGTYTVVWTFTDGSGNSSTATQTVIVAGVQFVGPDSPFSPLNSNCATPFSARKRTTIPFKFDLKCGDKFITTGPGPTVVIQRFSDCNTPNGNATTDVSTYYQNAWHYNWSTPNTTGLYKVTFTLNNIALKSVWVTVTN